MRNAFTFFHRKIILKIMWKKYIQLLKCIILFYVIVCKRKSYLKEYVLEKFWANNWQRQQAKIWKKTYARNLFLIPATQINTLKPFDMEPRKDISRKRFVSEEENNWEEEINLAPQDRIGNVGWCKCGCRYKPMATFAESFYLLLG